MYRPLYALQEPAVKKKAILSQWKAASRQIAGPPRPAPARKRKRKSGEGDSLPWRLPKVLSADEQIWLDYRIFKAAGLLKEWVVLYRHVLNLRF